MRFRSTTIKPDFKHAKSSPEFFDLAAGQPVGAAVYHLPAVNDEQFNNAGVMACGRNVIEGAQQPQANGDVGNGVVPYLFECRPRFRSMK